MSLKEKLFLLGPKSKQVKMVNKLKDLIPSVPGSQKQKKRLVKLSCCFLTKKKSRRFKIAQVK